MKISLITVCYNSENTIEDTIKSVLYQDYINYEYLIIDGGSKDNTLNIIKKYEKKFNEKMKYISEKDNGLYDAMNKGIKLSTGDYIAILNSDDVLANNNIFSTVVKNIKNDTEAIYGNILYCDEKLNKVVRSYKSGIKNNNAWCPAHPSLYIKREVFDRIGLYNLDYKVSSDYDFMVRMNINNIKYQYIDDVLVLMRIGGVSNGLKGYLNNFRDAYNILKNNKVSFPFFKTVKRSLITVIEILSKRKHKNLNSILEKRDEDE